MTREALLAALHFGDSAFPSGSFAFSWGLEGLVADGLIVDEADVALLVEDILLNRWRSFDRIVLRRVYDLADRGGDLGVAASRRIQAGGSCAPQCARPARLRPASAPIAYTSPPILGSVTSPVAQGVAWRAAGLALDVAEAVGAWTVATSDRQRRGPAGCRRASRRPGGARPRPSGCGRDPARDAGSERAALRVHAARRRRADAARSARSSPVRHLNRARSHA